MRTWDGSDSAVHAECAGMEGQEGRWDPGERSRRDSLEEQGEMYFTI